MTRHAPIRRRLAAATVAGAALLPVAACQAEAPTVNALAATATVVDQPTAVGTAPATPSAPSADATPVIAQTSSAAATPVATPSADRAGRGTGGPGSLTVAITSPVAVAGHVSAEVSCQTVGTRYLATASGSIQGYTVDDAVRVAGYHGPGSYPALVTLSVTGPQAHDAVSAVPATVEITTTGGDISFSATSDTGRTLAGSIAWACSA